MDDKIARVCECSRVLNNRCNLTPVEFVKSLCNVSKKNKLVKDDEITLVKGDEIGPFPRSTVKDDEITLVKDDELAPDPDSLF